VKRLHIEIAIPVYNEERRLQKGVELLHEFCAKQDFDFSIAIADNGSADRTMDIARRLTRDLPNIRIVSLQQKGVGRALKAAWDSSKADVIGYVDVDLSTDIRHLTEVHRLFASGEADVVTGSRLIAGAKVSDRKLIREISSRCFNKLLKIGLRVGFSDGMCGFKFLTKKSYDVVRRRGLENDEWFFNTEVLVKAEWANLRVKEIPVIWNDDPDSKAKILELAMKYTREIWRLRTLRSRA
jgi:glycosyltransferase involved in cell wall biosynthesis